RLDRGELDLGIGTFDTVGERFAHATLLEDRFVVVMRRGHPAGRGKLSAEALGALPHLEISSSGDDTGFIDRSLLARGARRQIAARLPYLATGVVLGQSNMVATLSRRVAEAMIRGAESALQLRELPLTSPVVRTSMLWHRRLDDSPAPPSSSGWATRSLSSRRTSMRRPRGFSSSSASSTRAPAGTPASARAPSGSRGV